MPQARNKGVFMTNAIGEAEIGIRSRHGGPFGAVIVKNGKIISRAHNTVIKDNDPTAHAEIAAIRKACKILKSFSLKGCEIYSTCEPCPMCLAAIYWARISAIYYGCTRSDAEKIGFDDNLIYSILKGVKTASDLKTIKMGRSECLKSFKKWKQKKDRIPY